MVLCNFNETRVCRRASSLTPLFIGRWRTHAIIFELFEAVLFSPNQPIYVPLVLVIE
jgi:hypothetical protein